MACSIVSVCSIPELCEASTVTTCYVPCIIEGKLYTLQFRLQLRSYIRFSLCKINDCLTSCYAQFHQFLQRLNHQLSTEQCLPGHFLVSECLCGNFSQVIKTLFYTVSLVFKTILLFLLINALVLCRSSPLVTSSTTKSQT